MEVDSIEERQQVFMPKLPQKVKSLKKNDYFKIKNCCFFFLSTSAVDVDQVQPQFSSCP